MFNIETTVSAIVAAEKVNNSRNLTDAEKLVLLDAVTASLMIDAPGCPEHANIVAASIERMTRNERANITARDAQEAQDGTPEGVEVETSVAAEGAEEDTEAPAREAEGSEELPEVAGSPARSGKRPKAAKPPSAS